MGHKFDFGGWATRNDLKCSDGRTIRKDAFKDNDGQTVPLVWQHQHNDPTNVLGHALLENRNEGVYAYCTFNDTEAGQNAKLLVQHGDITALSIYANRLQQQGGNVLHGAIREVSLVLAGANPGAIIDFPVISHGDDYVEAEDEAIIYTDEPLVLAHADDEDKSESKSDDKGEKEMPNNEKTVKDVFDSMTEEQKNVVYFMIGQALEDAGAGSDDEAQHDDFGGDEMKFNAFDQQTSDDQILTHADQENILKMAKSSQIGSFQTALEIFADDNSLQHDAVASGFVQTGDGNVSWLFPEYKDVRPGAPELITSDQGWISVVLNKVHKSPISRIRTRQVDIRNIDSLKAHGYKKGKEKILTGNFKLVRRTTDPQTIYVKNALHRDDIVDITDFDYVQYLYNIDSMMLKEELATAIMIGDGREEGAEDKISEEHIRPIWLDDDLYCMHVDLDLAKAKAELQGTNTSANFGDNYIYAEGMITTILYAREKFKGSGTPDLFCTPHMLNVMLLARDMNGRRIYNSKAELASALNVGEIYTVEQFEGKTRKDKENNTKKLLAILGNLADYSLGATKGGEITHFTQFDIDFNQEKSLIETRTSGALTRVYSFIAVEEPETAGNGEG